MDAPESRVKLLTERFEQGLDLFTGEPLKGTDKDEWTKLQNETRGQSKSFGISSFQLECDS